MPDAYARYTQSGWTLAVDPRLPVADMITQDGVAAGWIVGHLIDYQNQLFVQGEMILPFDSASSEDAKAVAAEETLYKYGGRYVCIVLSSIFQRIYLDAAASLSCVLLRPIASSWLNSLYPLR